MSELEQVRKNPRARSSTPTDPDEWTITEDGYRFGKGDRVYNYYDGFWVTVATDPMSHPVDPEYANGWFDTTLDNGRPGPFLNCVRVSSRPPERP